MNTLCCEIINQRTWLVVHYYAVVHYLVMMIHLEINNNNNNKDNNNNRNNCHQNQLQFSFTFPFCFGLDWSHTYIFVYTKHLPDSYSNFYYQPHGLILYLRIYLLAINAGNISIQCRCKTEQKPCTWGLFSKCSQETWR